MNGDGFVRACQKNGQMVIIKRLTGTRQVAFSVECLSRVDTGVESPLIGNVQQTADQVMVTDREMIAVKWPKPPRQGDQIVYADGSTRTVQGRAKVERLDEDTVYILTTLGG